MKRTVQMARMSAPDLIAAGKRAQGKKARKVRVYVEELGGTAWRKLVVKS